MKDYLLEVKYFRNIGTPQKPRGEVATTPPLYHGESISAHLSPRGNKSQVRLVSLLKTSCLSSFSPMPILLIILSYFLFAFQTHGETYLILFVDFHSIKNCNSIWKDFKKKVALRYRHGFSVINFTFPKSIFHFWNALRFQDF